MTTKDTKHYQAKSIRERMLFKKYLKNKNSFCFKFTPFDGTDEHDVTYFTLHYGLIKSIAEIKVRNIQYKHTNGGFYIEKPKYDYLMSNASKYDEVLYICIFSDGILIWDLKKIPVPVFQEELLPKNNHSNSTKEKVAGYLQFWDVKEEITMDIDIHKTLQKAYEILTRIGR